MPQELDVYATEDRTHSGSRSFDQKNSVRLCDKKSDMPV